MISHIEGILESSDLNSLVVDVNGVGYEITATGSVLRKLPKKGEKIKILTYLNVREDSMQLFGFSSKEEKGLFKQLLSVSGIGPKGAMTILSSFEINRLVIAITKGDVDLLTSAQGVGKKTAQRVIVELKEKIAKAYSVEAQDNMFSASEESPVMKDAVSALMTLGYSAKEAKRSVADSFADLGGKASIEDVIRLSLKSLS